MCDEWESVGDIAARILAAAAIRGGRQQPPPSGAAGEEARRSRNVIPFPEKGRAPTGGEAPGQGKKGGNSEMTGKRPPLTWVATGRSRRDTHAGKPPAGFRAHARN